MLNNKEYYISSYKHKNNKNHKTILVHQYKTKIEYKVEINMII